MKLVADQGNAIMLTIYQRNGIPLRCCFIQKRTESPSALLGVLETLQALDLCLAGQFESAGRVLALSSPDRELRVRTDDISAILYHRHSHAHDGDYPAFQTATLVNPAATRAELSPYVR